MKTESSITLFENFNPGEKSASATMVTEFVQSTEIGRSMTALGIQVLSLVTNRVREAFEVIPLTRRPSFKELQIYTLQEVSFHDSPYDCWIIIYDKIYNLTDFLQKHPGGDEVLLDYGGRDATLAFKSVGHTEPEMTELMLPYLIGILPIEERIWS